MSRNACSLVATVAAAALFVFPKLVAVAWADPPGRTVNASSVAELYAAINDLGNVGVRVVLAPGSYFLDPAKPHGGRLELQEDMEIAGRRGDSDAVIIDASNLPQSSYPGTGAIRLGQGRNALEWLTVQNALNGVAAIETDLPPVTTVTEVQVAHVIVQGNQRGIDVRMKGTLFNNQVLVGVFENNVLRNNTVGEAQGMRIVNTQDVRHATIRATLRGNRMDGNLVGLIAFNLGSSDNVILVDSIADQFTHNRAGCWLAGGGATLTSSFANSNFLVFTAHNDTFEANATPLSPVVGSYFTAGGLVAVGGWNGSRSTVANRTSDNTVRIEVSGSRFAANADSDIAAYGAYSSGPVLAGTGNRVELRLKGIKKNTAILRVASDPPNPGDTNAVVDADPHKRK